MLSFILSFFGWSYLPDYATQHLLPIVHRHFYQRVLRRIPPPPNTPLWWQHYRYVYAFTVFSYLCYNFRDAAVSMAPNYYETLGVEPVADENTLKSAFRQFARKNHPDRVGPQGESAFIEVRDAFDALKNPVTRFAYDRFGPDALKWTQCSTLREYIRHGLMQSSGFYIVAACALLLWSVIGKPSHVAFWRYLLFAIVFAYELTFILNSSPSRPVDSSLSSSIFSASVSSLCTTLFAFIWPQRVAYQHIRFLHSLFLFLSVALSRVAPVLFPSPQQDYADAKRINGEIDRINLLARLIDRDVSSQIQVDLHSVHGPRTNTPPTDATFAYVPPCTEPAEGVVNRLTSEMENMVIESQLRDGGPLKRAVDAVIAKQRRAQEQKTTNSRTGMPSPTPSPPPPLFLRHDRTSSHERPSSGSSLSGYVRGRSQSY
ncbi:chaperone J-domain-containing protein [Sparassis crispa]|uniref:Chaperone J-domain-containing protein n=1 Tax=Sparassis crispa TaxID=139825 RepID=A0A401GF18_9APHY|nr:chaperone J-domain-containing protein [Sparassis crispa]GBE80777.1 chaperone J-domain-containing protein [Sparassis crispa]